MGFRSDHSSSRNKSRPCVSSQVPLYGKMTSHFWSRQISQRIVQHLPKSERWNDKSFPESCGYEEFEHVEGVLDAAYCASWNIKAVEESKRCEDRETENDTDNLSRSSFSRRDKKSGTLARINGSSDCENVRSDGSRDYWNGSLSAGYDDKMLQRRRENENVKKHRRRRLFHDYANNHENETDNSPSRWFYAEKLCSDVEDDSDVCKNDDRKMREKSFKDVGVNTDDSLSYDSKEYFKNKLNYKSKIDEKKGYRESYRDGKKEKNYERRGSGSTKKKSDRHSRPLTPPKDTDDQFNSYSSNDLYENQYFVSNYLRNNTSGEQSDNGIRHSVMSDYWSSDYDRDSKGLGYSSSERNGTTVIKIWKDDYDGKKGSPRMYRHNSENDDEDEEDDEDYLRANHEKKQHRLGKSSFTPKRTLWKYRNGGVRITDIENGQPCSECGELCSGFSPHDWRKNCTSCKCPREAHEVCHEEWVSVRARLGLKGEEPNTSIIFDPREKGYAWTPPGLPAQRVEEYFSMIPEISVPKLGTPGERYRDRQLATQLPKQDLARAYCRHLEPEHSVSADDFMAARNEIALDIGSVHEVAERGLVCRTCKEPLKYGSLAVSASKLGLLYHPMCFQCVQCRELLVDLAYCVHDDALYCERHYAEQLKPRCAACDELIFSGEYTKAMNKDWHSGHFCCWQCDESLTGQRYVLRDEHPYCIKCYESVFANGCEECNKIIGIDSKDLSYKDKHWHEACFLCNKCRVSLVDKQFGSKVDKIYCGNCYDAQFASRCDGCGEIFRAGTKKMEYKTRQWHEKCFCCVVCKNPIGTKSFIPREQEIYCAGCYEEKFATRCVKCNKIITSGGVTYKNEPWHRDCFTCTNCNNSLAGQRFTSRDDKPYCAECFGELFAKRCTACSKPITGIGGTRFISFEDRHWHNDCFICAGCSTSLVGRGFITDGDDIICPDCAKSKLS